MESAFASGALDEADAPPPLAPGSTVGGKYVVQRMIGSGGNGRVYEATHATIGHRVAIKIVHARLSERTEVVARLGREARICGTLRHANIGQVYDVGSLESGVPYLVMELQEGLSLAAILEDTVLSVAAIVAIGRQLLAALATAHAAGVIHRDVKPDNVMVVRSPGGDVTVKLVDFGIAKQVDLSLAGKVTQRGVLVGSPDYMSPEQLRGESVDCRTDIYGVGVLLYEALTGQMPFHGRTVADLFASILREPVEPPTSYRPDCPPELQLAVLSALSRDPAHRPPNAEQMASALALVPLDDSGTGATLTDLHERLRGEAPESAVLVRRPRTRLSLGTRARLNEARRRLTPAPLRAAMICALALIVLPVLIAARNAASGRPTEISRTSSPHAAAPAPVQSVEPSTSSSTLPSGHPVTPVGLDETPLPQSDSNADAPVAPGRGAAVLAPGAAFRSSSRVRPPSNPTLQDDRTVDEARPHGGGALNEPAISERAVDDLLKQAATTFVRGDAARARDLYLQVLAREPQRAEALRGLGLALNRMSRNAEAVRAFERYLDRHADAPDGPRVREMLATARARAQADEARVAARQATVVVSFGR
jgi:serine/threonine-protein kinase